MCDVILGSRGPADEVDKAIHERCDCFLEGMERDRDVSGEVNCVG